MEQARWVNGPSSEWRRTNNPTVNSNHQTYFHIKPFMLDPVPKFKTQHSCQNNTYNDRRTNCRTATNWKVGRYQPIGCTSLLSQLYIRNLVELRNIDSSCESESAKKLAQLILFHKREALEPVEESCRNNEVVSQLHHHIETIEYSMKQICEAYRARTRQEFETNPRYISSLSTMELLLHVAVETQKIKDIGRPSL